jgi:endoglucanase
VKQVICLIGMLFAAVCMADEGVIVLNQVGYLPAWQKTALLVNAWEPTTDVEVLSLPKRNVVLRIRAADEELDLQTKDRVRLLDFSELTQSGRYLLRVGSLESHSFFIGSDIYKDVFRLLQRSYYLQRCGIRINDTETHLKHGVCHIQDGVVAHEDVAHNVGDKISSVGGWHDAGDYGKYVATTAVTVGRVLDLYEAYPNQYTDDQVGIPESGNNIPDILDEMRIGLDWMLTMQRADGAVYRKLSGKSWPHGLQPDQDKQVRWVYGVTTPETAKAAAAWAMAARIYQKTQPEKAAQYLVAARRAWRYLGTVEDQEFSFVEGDNSGSGPYMGNKTDTEASLTYDRDDRLWAAVELLITTHDSIYQEYVERHLAVATLNIFEWKDPSSMALSHYLFHSESLGWLDLKAGIKKKIIERANVLLQTMRSDPYRIANSRFVWGSNKMTVEEGMILVLAYRITQAPTYLDAAIDQLNYIFGRNHFNLSFVSGVGENSVSHVSHIYLTAANAKLPGLLVGGANELEQSGIAGKFNGQLSYVDDARSYATNEYAIDYNASLMALIGVLTNIKYSAQTVVQ